MRGILRTDAYFLLKSHETYHEIQKANISSHIGIFYFLFRSTEKFVVFFVRFPALKMLGMLGSSHVIDLWGCFENDFDKCEALELTFFASSENIKRRRLPSRYLLPAPSQPTRALSQSRHKKFQIYNKVFFFSCRREILLRFIDSHATHHRFPQLAYFLCVNFVVFSPPSISTLNQIQIHRLVSSFSFFLSNGNEQVSTTLVSCNGSLNNKVMSQIVDVFQQNANRLKEK